MKQFNMGDIVKVVDNKQFHEYEIEKIIELSNKYPEIITKEDLAHYCYGSNPFNTKCFDNGYHYEDEAYKTHEKKYYMEQRFKVVIQDNGFVIIHPISIDWYGYEVTHQALFIIAEKGLEKEENS